MGYWQAYLCSDLKKSEKNELFLPQFLDGAFTLKVWDIWIFWDVGIKVEYSQVFQVHFILVMTV